ncbi:MAG: hypothetical protein WBM24_14950 [Candidatus Sulfotelmatobacter sp.]
MASDDALGWIAVAVALTAAIVLDKGSALHKWHAAIMWTVVAFLGLLKFGQRKWKSWLFWIFCAACLGVHLFAMWLIFGQLLPRLILGTLYVIPLAIVEAILLTGIFYRLERNLSSQHHSGDHSGMRPTQGK